MRRIFLKYSEIPLLRPPKIKTLYLLKSLFSKFKLLFSSFSKPRVPLIRDHLWDCPKVVSFGQFQRWSQYRNFTTVLYPIERNLSSIVLTPGEIKLILKALPVGKATGPDGVSDPILSVMGDERSPPVWDFFNHSIRQGDEPDRFKESHECPIPKGDDPSALSNNRPISLLSRLSKYLKRSLFKYLYNHFRDKNIINSFQSGIKPGDSNVNQVAY